MSDELLDVGVSTPIHDLGVEIYLVHLSLLFLLVTGGLPRSRSGSGRLKYASGGDAHGYLGKVTSPW